MVEYGENNTRSESYIKSFKPPSGLGGEKMTSKPNSKGFTFHSLKRTQGRDALDDYVAEANNVPFAPQQ